MATDQVDTTNTHRLHVPALDGLRAGSFLLVFLSHVGLGNIIPGGFGVTVFFFISGYLITTLLRVEWRATESISLRGFYLRRALRIFPPFYIILALSGILLVTGALSATTHWWIALLQAAQITNYLIILAPHQALLPATSVYWSLAVEEHFYLIFPLAYLGFRRLGWSSRQQAAALAAVCAAILVWRCALVFDLHVSFNRTYLATDTRIDSIIFGCLLGVWRNPMLDRRRRWSTSDLWGRVTIGLLLLIVSFVVRRPEFRDTLRYTLQGIGLFLLVPLIIQFHDRGILRILSTKLVVRAGQLSYTLYLVHLICWYLTIKYIGSDKVVNGICALAMAWVFAEIMRRFIELPAARARRRIVDRQKQVPVSGELGGSASPH